MKKILLFMTVVLLTALTSCEKKEWKLTQPHDVDVLTLVATFPDKTDSIDIYREQGFIIQYQNKGMRLVKNALVTIEDSIDSYDYYCLNLTYVVADGYSYKNAETDTTITCDKFVNYAIEGLTTLDSVGTVVWPSDAIADLTYRYIDQQGDTLDIDYDYLSEIKIHPSKREY